jgi:hypothetical protein
MEDTIKTTLDCGICAEECRKCAENCEGMGDDEQM